MPQYPRCPNCGNNVVESWLWCRHCGFDPYAAAGATPPGAAAGQGAADPAGSSAGANPSAGSGSAYAPPGGAPAGGPGGGPAGGPYGRAGGYGYAPPGSAPGSAPPGYGPPGYGPPGYGPPGYGPPGYGPPGYGPPGHGAPGGGVGPAGAGPTPYVPAPKRSAGAVIAIVVAAVLLVPILSIAAVTLLGRNASSKFSRIDPVSTIPLSLPPTSVGVPPTVPTPTPGVTTVPVGPDGKPRKLLPGWVDHPSADGSWSIAFPNDFAEVGAPIGPFVAPPIEAYSAPLRDQRPAERIEVFVVDTSAMSPAQFHDALQRDLMTKMGYPDLASKRITVGNRDGVWYEPQVDQPSSLAHRFTSAIGVHAGARSFVLVIANGSGTADQDSMFQTFADSLAFT